MLSAILRLLLITIATSILAIFTLFLVRLIGLQQNFAAPEHKWFALKEWNVIAPSAENLCKLTVLIEKDEILEMPVRFREGAWIVDCPDKNVTIPLKDALTKMKAVNILLQVNATETQNLDNLVEIVGSFDPTRNFGIASISQKVTRVLRKKAPQWLFAADSASFLRLQLFTSLWIEPAMDFWPDFVIVGRDEETKISHLSPRLVSELARRHKPIIWADPSVKPPFDVHGTLTQR
jgi:hypothetical protein